MSEKSNLQFECDSELITNYKQVSVLDQTKKFLTAQTSEGHSLFFGIGTDDHLYLIREKILSNTGWEKVNLTRSLPGKVKTFDIAQNHQTRHIDLAIVMTYPDGSDGLYLWMKNSDVDVSWADQPAWVEIHDDRRQPSNAKLEIASVFLAESSDGTEYVVADTKDANGFIARYWIDDKNVQKWNSHELAADLAAGGMLSNYVGRKANDLVDGIYTLGHIGGTLELIYTPLYDPFDPNVAPTPTNIDLSTSKLTTTNAAMAGCKALSGTANATDIFLAGGGTLYYLAAEKQNHLASPIPILDSFYFDMVRELHAMSTDRRVVVWGLDHANEIFYVSCDPAKIYDPQAWSVPLPIATGVAEVSPYIDRSNEGLTIFANVGGGKLRRGVQDPITTRWKFSEIELPPPNPNEKATKALSYTTSVHVTDAKNNPAPGVDVTITAEGRTHLFINNLYYVLDSTPVEIKTDASGGLTIVEWVEGLQGTKLSIHAGDPAKAITVDPMAKPFQKVGAIDTPENLTGATIRNHDGSNRLLLPESVRNDHNKLSGLAESLKNLHLAYQGITSNEATSITITNAVGMVQVQQHDGSLMDYVEAAAGDVYRFLEHAGAYVVHLVVDEAKKAWHFVLKIGEAVYGFILDTVVKVAGALETIWNKICDGFDDLIDFLKFLFNWQDMLRTRNVMKQVIKIFFHRMGEELQEVRYKLDNYISDFEDVINEWAHTPESRLDVPSDQGLNDSLAGAHNPKEGHSAPARMLQSHFTNNVHRSTVRDKAPKVQEDPTWSGLTDLSEFADAERALIMDLVEQIKTLVSSMDGMSTEQLSAILKRVARDIAVAALELFEMVADKVLDFLTLLIYEISSLLDAPIYIPILSEILEDIFDIKLPSILDVICLIGAVPATLIYKAMHGKAPFPGGNDSLDEKITKANSFKELQAAFGSSDDEISLSPHARFVLFEIGHVISSIATELRAPILIAIEETEGLAETVLKKLKTVLSIVASASYVVSNLFLMPAPLKNEVVKIIQLEISSINLLQIAVFAVAPKAIAKIKGIKGTDALKALDEQIGIVSGTVDAVLALVGLVPQCFRIFEIVDDLVDEETLKTKDAIIGIMDSAQGITSRFSTILGYAALVDEEEESKQVLVLAQVEQTELTASLQLGTAVVEPV